MTGNSWSSGLLKSRYAIADDRLRTFTTRPFGLMHARRARITGKPSATPRPRPGSRPPARAPERRPGAFVVPGADIVSVIDRATVRVVVDGPEQDFDELAPGAPVRIELLAT